jgi:hypothetical protein
MSEPGANSVKVEAKRYTAAEPNRAELLGKLSEALLFPPAFDLWILAASCHLGTQLTTDLRAIADREGVAVMFLDVGTEGLPRLPVLMACFAKQVSSWATDHTILDTQELIAALTSLSTQTDFPKAKHELLGELNQTLLGYEDTRQRVRQQFLTTMHDDGNAIAAFGQPLALGTKSTIRRTAITSELNQWIEAWPSTQQHAVIIGEEGTRKTYAVMQWALEQTQRGNAPLLLPFCATSCTITPNDTIETLLPRLLATWTKKGTTDVWTRRLSRWLTSTPESHPLIVVIADGLNERARIPWPRFFQILEHEDWRTHVALIATDRPLHWQPKCANAGLDRVQEIKIAGYSDWELQQALSNRQVPYGAMTHDVLQLLRNPGYCDLVCEHYEQLQQEGDVTIERLILLHAQEHARRKRGGMTREELIAIIRTLAERHRTNTALTLSAIATLVPFADPERQIYQEIIDSGFLIPKSGSGGRHTVEPTRLVFGLGLLLAEELGDAAPADREHTLAQWFEPQRDMDLKVRICGAAVFHACIDDQYPAAARRDLLRYWLRLRNWDEPIQAGFLDYVKRFPQDFIALAEEFWSSTENLGAAQAFLGRSLLKHRDHPAVQPLLQVAIEAWMGYVHSAGQPIMRYDLAREKQLREEINDRAGQPISPGPLTLLGKHLTVTEDDGLLRLSRLSFLLISGGARTPFIQALATWAVASALMGWPQEASVADWVVRLSNEDIAQAIIVEAQRLIMNNHPLATKAAHNLLNRLDTPAARALREKYPLPADPTWTELQEEHAKDPCVSFLPWTEEDCAICLGREDVPVHVILNGLRKRIFNPNLPVTDTFLTAASKALDTDPTAFRASRSFTIEYDSAIQVLPLLGAHRPSIAADFVRNVVQTIPDRTTERLYPLALWLPEVAQVLQPDQVRVLEVLQQTLSKDPGAEHQGKNLIEAHAFIAISAHKAARDVLTLLVSRPPGAHDLQRFEPCFCPLPPADHPAATALLFDTSDATIIRALWFLTHTSLSLTPEVRTRIVQLVQSITPFVRVSALRFAATCNDEALGRQVVDLGTSYHASPGSLETQWGARILANHAKHLPFARLAQRLNAVDAGYALNERGNKPEEIRLYARSLDKYWEEILAAAHPGMPLPSVCLPGHDADTPSLMPEFVQAPDNTVTIKNPSTTWRVRQPVDPKTLFSDTDVIVAAMNQVAQDHVAAITAAWHTVALQWYGRAFSRSAIDQIYQLDPDILARWSTPTLGDGPVSQDLRIRLGGLLTTISQVLLAHDSPLGLTLWHQLKDDQHNPMRFDAPAVAFSAANTSHSNQARWLTINDSHTDAQVSRIAYLAEKKGRHEWLKATITELINDSRLWRRALGLTLAGFSNVGLATFDNYVRVAQITETWVEGQVPFLRQQVSQNAFARVWFHRFLNDNDEDASWGALQMLIECADERFFTWCDESETIPKSMQDRRLRILASRGQNLKETFNRDKARRDTLFGIKVERDEVVPFVT